MSLSHKKIAENQYKISLHNMTKLVGNDTTYDYQLNKAGKKLWKSKFKGVFSSDTFPKHISKGSCYIVNLDKSTEEGSHWIAVCKEKNSDVLWVYDSFARDIHRIAPSLYKSDAHIKTTEKDVEQKISQNNCGARSLAFIDVFYKMGPNYAKWI